MSLIDLIVNRGLEALGRYYSTYRGIVVDNTEDGQNRLTVVIPSICKSPILAYPKGQEGSQDSGFKWFTPSPGQVVYVEFIQGDLAYPLWSYHGWAKDEIPDELKSNSTMGFKSKRGHLVTIDEDSCELNVVITNPSDEGVATKLTIKENQVTLVTYKGEEVYSEVSLGETINLDTKAEVILKSPKISLNSSDEGLPLSSELIKRINKLEDEINSLRSSLKIASPAVVALAPTFATVQNWSIKAPLAKTLLSDISNKKVLQ